MLAAALFVLAAAVVGAAWLHRTPESLLRSSVKRRCLVACKDGQTFSGVLWSADRGCLVLKQAAIVGDGGTASVDGEVLIFRADVAFVQTP